MYSTQPLYDSYLSEPRIPQYVALQNNLGMNVSFENLTNDLVILYFIDQKKKEALEPYEVRYFIRDVDIPLYFTIEENKIYNPSQKLDVHQLHRYVNSVVIKRVGINDDPINASNEKIYQPSFFFTTRKFNST